MTAALHSRAVAAAALAEDDQRVRPNDLRAAASAAPGAVDDPLEVVDIGDPQVHESIGIAGQGERHSRIAAGVPDALEAIDPPLRRRGGEANETADLAGRSARVFHEQVQDPVVDGVDTREGSLGRGSADDSVERSA